jgi:hypothetical protein
MSQLKQIPFVLLLSVFGTWANAQTLSLVPIEGSLHSYTCNGVSEGCNYVFNIVADNGGQPGDFDFIGSNAGVIGNDGIATTQIQWNSGSSLNTYKVWLEVEYNGCSNRIYIGVSPQPNNRSLDFGITASTECFNLNGNNFSVSIITKDNNGQPIPAAYFPLLVEFSVNGAPQSQLLSFDNQQLLITETMFSALPDKETPVEVVLTSVTDVKNAPVQPGANDTHVHTIHAIPAIEFTEELRKRYYESESFTAYNSPVSDNSGRVGSR